MDTSPSTAGKMEFSKRAAKDFIYGVTRVRKDRAAFMTFDNEVTLQQDFTDKLDLLDKAVDKVKKVGSQTALYDAIWMFTDEKLRSAPGRRVIVIITDGDDTFSRADLRDAIDIAQRTETVIFVISTKAGGFFGVQAGTVDRQEDKDIKRLAEDTGGRAFFTAEVIELERSFTRIAIELRSQYILSYSPTNERFDGKFRTIEVRLPNYKNYRIRAKKGYSALPPRSFGARQ